jgi:predicted phage-related endonuclease
MEWLEGNRIKIDPPKHPKKITGTRFAAILGKNPWSTPFEVWCDITKTYKEPFVDNMYTLAGKAIEPKQQEYMKKAYYMTNLLTPEDVFGQDYFRKTGGDFFKDDPIFGGMWDSKLMAETLDDSAMIEFKTTKRAEDWDNDMPEYYALQVALYAWLESLNNIIMVASFLEDKDYSHPTLYEPNASNTIVRPFRLSERYPDFLYLINKAIDWWEKHVVTGISPPYDEKKDKAILEELRKVSYHPETDIEALVSEAEELKQQLDEISIQTAPMEKRLKQLNEILKSDAMDQFTPDSNKVQWKGSQYEWTLAKIESKTIDKDRLEQDGLLEKYQTVKTSYRLTTSLMKEEE